LVGAFEELFAQVVGLTCWHLGLLVSFLVDLAEFIERHELLALNFIELDDCVVFHILLEFFLSEIEVDEVGAVLFVVFLVDAEILIGLAIMNVGAFVICLLSFGDPLILIDHQLFLQVLKLIFKEFLVDFEVESLLGVHVIWEQFGHIEVGLITFLGGDLEPPLFGNMEGHFLYVVVWESDCVDLVILENEAVFVKD
jgi:hypothetical protein